LAADTTAARVLSTNNRAAILFSSSSMKLQGSVNLMGLLKTKTFWVGLAAIFTAIGLAVSGEGSWGEVASAFIIGLGFITGRHAIAKVQK
jgi:hypothetical protein